MNDSSRNFTRFELDPFPVAPREIAVLVLFSSTASRMMYLIKNILVLLCSKRGIMQEK